MCDPRRTTKLDRDATWHIGGALGLPTFRNLPEASRKVRWSRADLNGHMSYKGYMVTWGIPSCARFTGEIL